jgi:LysM domain
VSRKAEQELFAALALAAYLVQPGDTLSGIAASHGVSLAAIESANPQFSNPNLIFAGQSVSIPGGSSATQGSTASYGASTYHAPTYHQSTSASSNSSGSSGGSGSQGKSSYSSPSSISSATTKTSTTGSSSAASGSSGYSSGSLSNIPGVPQSFAACVAYRESTNLQNPAARGNAYGIIPASGYNVYGTSIANQKQVFAQLYQKYGSAPWAPSDGC